VQANATVPLSTADSDKAERGECYKHPQRLKVIKTGCSVTENVGPSNRP